MHFAETMDPPSPIRRDLEHKEILEDMINDNVDPAESPSSYLNPSGDEIEHEVDDRREDETDRSDDGEGDNSDDGEAGRYTYQVRRLVGCMQRTSCICIN